MKNYFLLASIAIAPMMFVASAIVVPALAATLISSEIGVGSTGADVTTLQTFLATDPTIYPQGLVTGVFGPLTEAAVVNWQTANNISATGFVGPLTLAAINADLSGGVAVTTGSSADIGPTAPIIELPTVAVLPSTNSASITWTTNEPSYSRVMFGSVYPFLYATAPSVQSSNGFSTSANVTINGLNPNTTYYYTLESKDANGTFAWTIERPFTTE